MRDYFEEYQATQEELQKAQGSDTTMLDMMEQLIKQVTTLNQELSKENERYVSLKKEHEKLKKEHSALEEDYDSLLDDYESLSYLYEEEIAHEWGNEHE